MAELRKWDDSVPWAFYTDQDVDLIHQTKCRKCAYRGAAGGFACCDYILHTGHSRGCSPAHCDKYTPGKRRRIRVGISNGKQPAKVQDLTGGGGDDRKTGDKPSKTYFGLMIDSYVQEKKIDYRAFAELMGVSLHTVTAWRNGRQRIGDIRMQKISKLLNVSIERVRSEIDKGRL